MAAYSGQVAQFFPAGATVGAYRQSNWATFQLPPSGAPQGSADASGTVAADGSLSITGLAANTDYFLAGQASGAWKYIRYRTAPDVSGAELGYAQITSDFSTASGTPVDVPGGTFSLPASSRPISLRFDARALQNGTSGDGGIVQVVRTDTSAVVLDAEAGFGTGTATHPTSRTARIPPLSAATIFKVQAQAVLGGTFFIRALATSPALLEAILR
jgi:hypothetical protein